MAINKYPDGDMWSFVDKDEHSRFFGRKFIFDFSFIGSDEIKSVLKEYIWFYVSTGGKTLSALYDSLNKLAYSNQFFENNQISSLQTLSNNDMDDFMSFLRVVKSTRTNKPISYNTQRSAFSALRTVIYWGQVHSPENVPSIEIFTGNEFRAPKSLKIDFIPDDVLTQINKALFEETNPYVKHGIVILEATGMRIGDFLKLGIDCIKPHSISGYAISWYDHKNRRGRPPMPVNNNCVYAVEQLLKYTESFRNDAPEEIRNLLFIHKASRGFSAGKVVAFGMKDISRLFKIFVDEHKIVDTAGSPYYFTAHQFRRTLGTDMLSKGTNINVIQQVLGNADPAITKKFYADVKDKERAETFKNIGIIGNINLLDERSFENPAEFEWFKSHKENSACLCDGYCTKPIVDGQVCERLLRRQKCYTCSRYITTPEYLEAHRRHLEGLERQVTEGAIYGEHYAEHFLPTIEILKIIIARLEEMQNGSN